MSMNHGGMRFSLPSREIIADGVEAVVRGHAKGFGYPAGQPLAAPPDHAWNAVRLGGAWHLLDATWGAGTIDAHTRAFRRRLRRSWRAPPSPAPAPCWRWRGPCARSCGFHFT